jgi:hypothetical protein
MALVVWLAGLTVSNLAVKMLLQLFVGAAAYIVFSLALKIESFNYILNFLKNKKEA